MKELTKVFNGVELKVRNVDEDNFYVDIHGVAKRHNRKITYWSSSKRFKEYLSAREKSPALRDSLIIGEIQVKEEMVGKGKSKNEISIH